MTSCGLEEDLERTRTQQAHLHMFGMHERISKGHCQVMAETLYNMNFAAKLCQCNGRLFAGVTSLRLQTLTLREFSSGNSLRTSMRHRMDRIRRQVENRTPFTRTETVSLDGNRAIILGGAALGLGGLCLYGIYAANAGANSLSVLDRAAVWPDYVRQRIHSTYAYLAGGAAVAAASATALARSPAFVRAMAGGGVLAPLAMLAASIGAGVVCQMVPYPADGSKFNVKHLAWLLYAVSLGGVVAPICLLGGPILTRAAVYTGGIVGGLSVVAISAPSDRFLRWGGPLAIGLGVVFVSSLGSMFLSPMGRLGAGLYSISLYGGLILFSCFLLYDTQMVVHRAEQHPPPPSRSPYSAGPAFPMVVRPFDPINNSIKILLDTLNIFVRMVAIFAGGGQRRKPFFEANFSTVGSFRFLLFTTWWRPFRPQLYPSLVLSFA
ncbi:growth hormone inducible transmembrane protein [Echinococcus multilocularis]|uniref:Growth hormone inducible transmembrane protein n=1 Tax=Echinococcus multilocularis TaxID=6211 RepID=A0A068YG85_ECHMU|nr:growth hormone inducible transmembrane protein [Echinococcus multilocularis]